MSPADREQKWLMPRDTLDDLIKLLQSDGFEVVGPRIDQQAIVYDRIESMSDLPIGWTDRQAPGSYRLEKRSDDTVFGFAVGPHSWKKYLFPPHLTLWRAQRTDDGFEVTKPETAKKHAFLGVRSCELHAIAVQDRVFLQRDKQYTDPHYAHTRSQSFLIAVECEHPGGTCFCSSMGTGPHVDAERIPLPTLEAESTDLQTFDICLTELDDSFVVRANSETGRKIIGRLQLKTASDQQIADARKRVDQAADAMGRELDTGNIRELLHDNQEHPRWDNVAERCLACTNCTLVCPTCFCSSVEDVPDLSLESAERVRSWDSCFNPEFAQVHGGNFRSSIRGRYRQWLTHKFASWFDQFDVSGCVGCGRCITWCPVGIDVTEEITAIRASNSRQEESTS